MKLGKCKIHSNKTLFICAFNCDFKKVCKFVENARSGTVKCSFTVVLMFSRIIVPLSPGSSTEIKMIKHLFSLDCLTLNIKTLQSFQKSGNTCPSHSRPSAPKLCHPNWLVYSASKCGLINISGLCVTRQEKRIHFSYEGTHSAVQSCNVCD